MKKSAKLIVSAVFYVTLVVLILVSAIQFLGNDVADLGITLGIVLLAIGALAILLFSGYQLIDNPRKSLTSVIGFVAIVIVFFIAFSSSSGAETYDRISETGSKLVGGSLALLYILGIAAVFSIIVSEIWSIFK